MLFCTSCAEEHAAPVLPPDEDVIREGLEAEFATLADDLKSSERPLDTLRLKDATLSVDDVRVDGSYALATVTVNRVDIAHALDEAKDESSSIDVALQIGEIYASEDDDMSEKLGSYLFEIIDRRIEEEQKVVQSTLVLQLTKSNDVWRVESESLDELVDAMTQKGQSPPRQNTILTRRGLSLLRQQVLVSRT